MSKPASGISLRSKLKDKLHIHSKPKKDRKASPAPSSDSPSQEQLNTRQAELPQETTTSTSAPVEKPAEALETVRDDTKASQVDGAGSTPEPPLIKTNLDIDMGPIHELWNEAYEELKVREESLVKDYETGLYGSVEGLVASTGRIGREDLMKSVIDRKLKEYEDGKLMIKGMAVKDMMKPVVGIVKWADTYVSSAISANPVASIAWAGVTVFLPVSTVGPFVITGRTARTLEAVVQFLKRVRSSHNVPWQLDVLSNHT